VAILFVALAFRQPQQQPDIEATVQAVVDERLADCPSPADIEATVQAAIDAHVAEYHAPAAAPAQLLPAPELILPVPNDTIYARDDALFPARFSWRWDGELPPGAMFELRIWRDGRDPVSLGAYDARDAKIIASIGEEEVERFRETQYLIHYAGDGVYWLDFNPAGAQIVTTEYQTYVWLVAVVQVEPYQRIGAEAPPRPVNIQVIAPPTPAPVVQ